MHGTLEVGEAGTGELELPNTVAIEIRWAKGGRYDR